MIPTSAGRYSTSFCPRLKRGRVETDEEAEKDVDDQNRAFVESSGVFLRPEST